MSTQPTRGLGPAAAARVLSLEYPMSLGVHDTYAGAQKAVAEQIYSFTGKRPNTNELFRALARTKVTWDINLSTLGEYAQLNKEAGFARDVPDLNKFVNLSVIRGLAK